MIKKRKESVFLLATIMLFIQFTNGEMYPFGPAHGDTNVTFNQWSTGNSEIILLNPIPFMGAGSISKIWISTFGSISYSAVQDWRLNFISNNIIVSPFFILSQEGTSAQVFYRQTDSDDYLFQQLSRDINLSMQSTNDQWFQPKFALVVTWYRLASLSDSSLLNSFQMVLTSNGLRTYAIFNYGDITWTSANGRQAAAGMFAIGDKSASCFHHLFGSGDLEVSLLSKLFNAPGIVGRHVFDLTDPLRCTSQFETPCGVIPKSDRGFYVPSFENTANNYLGWEFYVMFSCKEGFYIRPNVRTQNVRCLYEADYYEYAWELRTPKCIDLNATRQFETTIEVGNLSDTSLQWFNDIGEINVRLITLIEDTVIKLLDTVGITGTVINVNNITNSTTRSDNQTIVVDFTTFVPTYTNRKLTNNTMKDKISTGTSKEINLLTFNKDPIVVTDVTNKCLQACLCRMRFDPATCRTGKFRPDIQSDACCGDCFGIPYSSLIKACCVDKLYDPKKAICCNGKIRGGTRCPNT